MKSMKSALNTALMVTGAAYRVCESTSAKSVSLFGQPNDETRIGSAWENESTFGISSALAYQIVPNVVIGADLWYLRHYDGAAFKSFTGDTVYLGPTFYWKIAPKVLMSAAWETQIAGHEPGVSARLDFTDFSRQRARLLLEFEF